MELCEVYPLGPVVDGVALNVTVQSYRDSLFVGINACATAVPELPSLAAAMVAELDLLNTMASRTRRQGTVASARHHRASGAPEHEPVAAAAGDANRVRDRSGAPA
jgi:hypothetical protein